MVTLENRFSWLFLQAFYCQNEKQKHNFFFFNENYGNKGLTVVAKFILLRIDVTTQARRHGGIGVARGGPKGPEPPPIEMLPMIKM